MILFIIIKEGSTNQKNPKSCVYFVDQNEFKRLMLVGEYEDTPG